MILCRKCSRELPEDAVLCCYCGVKQALPKRGRRIRGNGQGSIYPRSDRPGWTVAYTVSVTAASDAAGRPRLLQKRKTKSGFATKREANQFLAGIIAQKEENRRKQIPTVAKLYDQYENAPGKKPGSSTLSAYRTAFNRRIGPAIGEKLITAVTLHDLECVISGLTYDPAKDVKDLMSKLFQRAIADEFVQVNPTTLLSLPEPHAKKIPAWHAEEIESLWIAWGWGDRIAACCLLMIHSGMMPGELMKCRVDMIDWEAHTIRGCGLKTKERRENPIVFPPVVEPVLRDLCETSPSHKGFVLGMNKDKFYERFGYMKKALYIREEVVPYSGRHSTATELELLGVSPSVIATVLRHKNYATTAKHYMDISTTAALAAVSQLSRSLSSKPATAEGATATR